MIQCPECRSMIPDDSAFCDQCGKELKWCPECKRPKRGTECPVCGSDLVPGRKYLAGLAGDLSSPQAGPQGGPLPSGDGSLPLQPRAAMASGEDRSPVKQTTSYLSGNGWKLPLKEGPFGRNGGIWPELSSCPYVSGSHGSIQKSGSDWIIVDNNSTNGTFINDRRIQRESLKKGDRVRIATLDFTVE